MLLRVSALVAALLPAAVVAIWDLGTSLARDNPALALLGSSVCLAALAAGSLAPLPLTGLAPLGERGSAVGIVVITLSVLTAVSILLAPKASAAAPAAVALVVLGLGARWVEGRRRRHGMTEVASAIREFCSARRERRDERAERELIRTFDDRTKRSLPWSLAAEITASPVFTVTVVGVWLAVASAPSPADVGLLVCAPAATMGMARLWDSGVSSPRGGAGARRGFSGERPSTGSVAVAVVAACAVSGLFAVAVMDAAVGGFPEPAVVGVLFLGVVLCWCFSAGVAQAAGVRELARQLALALDRAAESGGNGAADDPATPPSGTPPTSGATDPCARVCADAIRVSGAPVHVLRPAVLGGTSAALLVFLLLARSGSLPVVCLALAILPRVLVKIPAPAAAAVSFLGAGLAIPLAVVAGISSLRSATTVGALTLVLVVALDEVAESMRRWQEQHQAHQRLVSRRK